MRIHWLGLAWVSTMGFGSAALACSWPQVEAYPITAGEDETPPGVPTLTALEIARGQDGPEGANCDGLGSIALDVTATDDVTAPGDLGYLITIVDGESPVSLPQGPIKLGYGERIILALFDGDTPDAFRFVVVVRAVDAAGNVGPPSAPIVIEDGGRGCTIGGRGGPEGFLPLALLALALLLRRIARPDPRAQRPASSAK